MRGSGRASCPQPPSNWRGGPGRGGSQNAPWPSGEHEARGGPLSKSDSPGGQNLRKRGRWCSVARFRPRVRPRCAASTEVLVRLQAGGGSGRVAQALRSGAFRFLLYAAMANAARISPAAVSVGRARRACCSSESCVAAGCAHPQRPLRGGSGSDQGVRTTRAALTNDQRSVIAGRPPATAARAPDVPHSFHFIRASLPWSAMSSACRCGRPTACTHIRLTFQCASSTCVVIVVAARCKT